MNNPNDKYKVLYRGMAEVIGGRGNYTCPMVKCRCVVGFILRSDNAGS